MMIDLRKYNDRGGHSPFQELTAINNVIFLMHFFIPHEVAEKLNLNWSPLFFRLSRLCACQYRVLTG